MGKALKLTWRGTPGQSYKDVEAKVLAGATKGADAIGLITTNAMKAAIQRGPKTGALYQLYLPRREHRASAVGEFPASDTGKLVASIGYDTGASDGYDVAVTMFAGAAYAMPLELKPSSKGGRPFMGRTIDTQKAGYPAILKASIDAELK